MCMAVSVCRGGSSTTTWSVTASASSTPSSHSTMRLSFSSSLSVSPSAAAGVVRLVTLAFCRGVARTNWRLKDRDNTAPEARFESLKLRRPPKSQILFSDCTRVNLGRLGAALAEEKLLDRSVLLADIFAGVVRRLFVRARFWLLVWATPRADICRSVRKEGFWLFELTSFEEEEGEGRSKKVFDRDEGFGRSFWEVFERAALEIGILEDEEELSKRLFVRRIGGRDMGGENVEKSDVGICKRKTKKKKKRRRRVRKRRKNRAKNDSFKA